MIAEIATLVMLAVIYNRKNGENPLRRCINENPEAKFFFSLQTDKNNFEYAAAKTAKDFTRDYVKVVFQPGCHFDEVIRDSVPVKLFIDVDSKTGEINIGDMMDVVNEHAMENGFKLDAKKVLVDTSHGDGKHSYHVVYNGIERFETMSHLKAFMSGIDLSAFGVDLKVYEKNHSFRIHGSSRHGSERYMGSLADVTTKKNGTPNAQYRKFLEARLITNTDGCKKIISIDHEKPSPAQQEQTDQRFEVDVMNEFQNFPESNAFAKDAREIITTKHGVDYILNRTAPSYCEGCARTHDSNNAKIFVGSNTGGAFISCYRGSKPRFLFQVHMPKIETSDLGEIIEFGDDDLPNVADDKPKQKKTKARADPAKLHSDLKRGFESLGQVHMYDERYCASYEPLMESSADIIVSKSKMGTGKSRCSAMRAEKSTNRLCIVSFRLSLTSTYKNTFSGSKAYTDIDGGITNEHKRIVIQPESMHRVRWSNNEKFTLIVDECSQIRRQLTGDTFRSQPTARDSFAEFKWLMRYADKIELMDANITPADVRFFMSMRGKPSIVETFWNQHDLFSGRTLDVYSAHSIVPMAVKSLEDGKRVYLATNCGVDGVSAIAELFRQTLKDTNRTVLEISSSTIDQPDVIAAMKDTSLWKNYAAVVVSPSIQSGVSYDCNDPATRFDNIYAVFGNSTNLSSDAVQMLYRVRHPSSPHIAIEINKTNNNIGSTNPSVIMRGLQLRSQFIRAAELGAMTSYEYDERHIKVLQRNDYMQLFLANEVEKNKDYFNYRENIINHHLSNGFTVEEHELELSDAAIEIKRILKGLRAAIKLARADSIGKANNISDDEAKRICSALKKTSHVDRARVNEVKKFKTLALYGIDPEVIDELDEETRAEWFLKHSEHKTKSQFRNLVTLSSGFLKSIKAVETRELEARESELLELNDPERCLVGDQMDVAQTLSLINTKRLFPKWNVVVNWLIKLGFKDMWDDEPKPAEDILARAAKIRDRAGDLNNLAHLLDKPKRRMIGLEATASDAHVLRFMNAIFISMFGIKLKGDSTKKKPVTFYTLTAPGFNRHKDDECPWLPWIEEDEGEEEVKIDDDSPDSMCDSSCDDDPPDSMCDSSCDDDCSGIGCNINPFL